MSEPSHSESQLPEDPFSRTPTWHELNIKYGQRPKGGLRAGIAFLAPALIVGAVVGAAEIFGHAPHKVAAETVHTDVPKDALGKMAVDVTMFEGTTPQIEWSQLP